MGSKSRRNARNKGNRELKASKTQELLAGTHIEGGPPLVNAPMTSEGGMGDNNSIENMKLPSQFSAIVGLEERKINCQSKEDKRTSSPTLVDPNIF